jgi:starch phosphorylase
MEFLPGRSLANHLYSLGLFGACRSALGEMGMVLEDLLEEEGDAPFGNGGLGRLAACFLDSMATLGLAGQGYGLHYEYGLFRQEIDNGYQKEKPDAQPSRQSPWEIERPDEACLVPLYGRIEHGRDRWGGYNPMWVDWSVLIGVPYDRPVSGYGGHTVNPLRLYAARASSEFDVTIFNEGDYVRAVEEKIAAETVSKILYPSDTVASGRELRLYRNISWWPAPCGTWSGITCDTTGGWKTSPGMQPFR